MALPPKVTKWADADNALKEEITEDRKASGWVKLANGFGEKPPLKIYNGWMNLVHRWIKYLTANQTPVGHMIHSTLSESAFNSVSPAGEWVLADGRNIEGSAFETLTGRETVPDMRALYPLMTDTELDDVEYSVLSESIKQLHTNLVYDKGSLLPTSNANDNRVYYDISSAALRPSTVSYWDWELLASNMYFAVSQTNNNARYYYNSVTNSYDNRPPRVVDAGGPYKFRSSNISHSHSIDFGDGGLPDFITTNSKITRGASKTVNVGFDNTSRLLPKTYTVNIYIRIN